jgi:predicted metalloprotease
MGCDPRVLRMKSAAVLAIGAINGLSMAYAAAPAADAGLTRRVFDDTGTFWTQQFTQLGGHYQPPGLTLYSAQSSGLCEQKEPMSGAFYCPADQHLYLDPKALEAIGARARADSAVAQSFVIAHLVAHHVQYLIGTTALVQQARSSSTAENANRTLVTLELQADCYAGLWLHSAAQHNVLTVTPEALSAAVAAVANESLARAHALPAGTLVPDPMDTGTAAQRLRWTQRGFESGNFEGCDTFGAAAKGEL